MVGSGGGYYREVYQNNFRGPLVQLVGNREIGPRPAASEAHD
jgi:hypothetical protein